LLRASLTVDLNALERNYRALRARIPAGVRVLCVVKADAYGHGAVQAAARYEAIGVDYFGVATVEEGVELRERGISSPILVMGGIMPWEETSRAFAHRLTPAVTGFGMLKKIVAETGPSVAAAGIHIKIDTGMGRLGFRPDEIPALVTQLTGLRRVTVEGVMTHFASSEKRDDYGLKQIGLFRDVVDLLKKSRIEPQIVHMANSGAFLTYPESLFSMVRLGIMLYGSYPDLRMSGQMPLEPVLKFSSRIAAIRDFPPGSPLSYGRTFVTERPMRIAQVPVGYADGYPRALSNKGSLLIAGRRSRIVGRICMDWLLADVTDLPDAKEGDEVVFLGRDGEEIITANELAARAGTIPYEILCGLSRRIARNYV
jgi:alanine racemase